MLKRLVQLALLVGLLARCVPAQAQVTFFGAGAIAGATLTTDPAPALPASTATNDIIFVVCWVRSTANTTVITDYVEVAQVDTGTGDHRIFWKRHDGTESDPTCDRDTSADAFGRVYVFRGVRTTGNPWDVISTYTADNGTSDPTTFTGITTATEFSMVAVFDSYEDDDASVAVVTGTDPAAYTENYAESSTGADGSSEISYAIRGTAGATGDVSINYGTISARSDDMAVLIMALVPASAPCLNTDYGQGFTCRQDGMWGSTTSTTGGTVNLAAATTAGNNVIVALQFCSDSSCSATPSQTADFTNSAGNTETEPTTECRNASSSASFVYRICISIFANVSAATTFTGTCSATCWYARVHAVEIVGGNASSPFDGDTAIGATSGAQTSLSVAYTSSGTVFNYGSLSTFAATATTPGTGFTEIREGCSEGTCGNGNEREGRGVTSGSNACAWTFGSDQAIGMCIGMAKAAAGGAAPPPTHLMLTGVGS